MRPSSVTSHRPSITGLAPSSAPSTAKPPGVGAGACARQTSGAASTARNQPDGFPQVRHDCLLSELGAPSAGPRDPRCGTRGNETAAWRRRFAHWKAQPTKTSIVVWRPEHRDAAVGADRGGDLVRRQGHEHVIVMRIDGNRVRGSPRGWRSRRGIERRNTLDQSLVLRVDHAEDGAERVRARGGVVPSVPGVEPDFVRSPNARNPLVDCARFCVQTDLDGDRWVRIRRTPRMTDGVEDYAATNEQILVRTEV